MKKTGVLLLALSLVLGFATQGEAAIVVIGGPGVALTYRQPVQAVIVDNNGNRYEQTVYYDPAMGGVDVDTTWAGPNASVYFPAYGTRYLWYNGYWVDQAGYYWNGGNRIYIGHPYWHDHWAGYWNGYGHGHGWYHSSPEVVHVHKTVHEHIYHHR